MSIRITRTLDVETTVLQVDGRLSSADVDVLMEEFRQIDGPVVLELAGLQSADSDGVTALREISSLGADLRGASLYIELLLERTA